MAKILIADDEQYIAQAYMDGFSRAGHEVHTVGDGEAAVEQANKLKPDVILLDLIMPKMNGFEVLKALKDSADLKTIPVVILSNLSQETDRQEVMKLGAADFIIKSDKSLKQVIEQVSKQL